MAGKPQFDPSEFQVLTLQPLKIRTSHHFPSLPITSHVVKMVPSGRVRPHKMARELREWCPGLSWIGFASRLATWFFQFIGCSRFASANNGDHGVWNVWIGPLATPSYLLLTTAADILMCFTTKLCDRKPILVGSTCPLFLPDVLPDNPTLQLEILVYTLR